MSTRDDLMASPLSMVLNSPSPPALKSRMVSIRLEQDYVGKMDKERTIEGIGKDAKVGNVCSIAVIP